MRNSNQNRPLHLLPFDHRHSFIKGVFHWHKLVTPEQAVQIVSSKQLIYGGLEAAAHAGVLGTRAGIVVDQLFDEATGTK